jgi:hypothetical protein
MMSVGLKHAAGAGMSDIHLCEEKLCEQIKKLRELKEHERQIKREVDNLSMSIKLELGESTVAVNEHGEEIATFKPTKASYRFDPISFKEAHPALYEEYSTIPTQTRRLVIKDVEDV